MGAQLWGGLIFGSLALGYWTYGRRQGNSLAQICAVALGTLPFFVPSTLGMIATGVLLAAIPPLTGWYVSR